MFTGIIHNLGTVEKRQARGGQVRFGFRLAKAQDIKPGQSVAVSGVCLTAARTGPRSFEADVMKATLEATTLGKLRRGDSVNLERALRYGDEMGGHFVTGHVDARARILEIRRSGKNFIYVFSLPPAVKALIAAKGSVTLDGISLTVQTVEDGRFTVGIIPHTRKVTTLKGKRLGDEVNLEADLIARYTHTLQTAVKMPRTGRLKLKDLRRQGF